MLEAYDFAKGTSSRSTKLVHGGVRYLANGDVALVREALRERGRLAQNAGHLVKNQNFIIPNYTLFNSIKYCVGRGQGCSKPPTIHRTFPSQQRVIKQRSISPKSQKC